MWAGKVAAMKVLYLKQILFKGNFSAKKIIHILLRNTLKLYKRVNKFHMVKHLLNYQIFYAFVAYFPIQRTSKLLASQTFKFNNNLINISL